MSERHPRTRAEAKAAQGARARDSRARGSRPGAARASRPGAPAGRRAHPWRRRILLTLTTLLVIGAALVTAAFVLIDVPEPNQFAQRQATIIYYSDGKTVLDRVAQGEGNREIVPLKRVPTTVQHAMIAAEDRDFYNNQGISPTGIGRAVWTGVTGGKVTQGGSTITQQYVRNYFLSQDRTLSRKLKEIVISIKIDGQQSKDQILENYLNTIYYGRGGYGIQTAARAYFGKDVGKLTLSEGALLASVINGPSLYDPRLGAAQARRAKERWAYVLSGMVEKGWLTPQQKAAATFPQTLPLKVRRASGPSGYITQLVKKELRSQVGADEAQLEAGGLKIVTTIEAPKQRAAVAAMQDRLPDKPAGLQAGLVSIKPGDGAIVALYGGKDFAKREQNSATQDKMQGGSTFKPFTLISALRTGEVSTRSEFPGTSPMFFDQFVDPGGATSLDRRGGVKNFGGESFGTISVRKATAHSVNTVYARLNIIGTPKGTVEAAKSAGVTTRLAANYANVFGTDSVSVLEMANAYATIAANGQRAEPYIIRSVRSPDGSLDYTAEPKVRRVFDEDLMSDVIDCMRAVVEEGSGDYARRLDRPAAGKTGTTSGNTAAWFDGFVPQLATAVALYYPGPNGEQLPLRDIGGYAEVTGSSIPVRIWTRYMREALEGTKVEQFPEPAHINKEALPPTPTALPTPTAAPTTAAPLSSVTSTPSGTPTPSTSAPTSTPSLSPPPTSTPTTAGPTPTRTKPGNGRPRIKPTKTKPPGRVPFLDGSPAR